ncbi:zinc metalloproteinase nas-15-like [Tachypleus tridentatus]|uniref:zinc metalloproteinase nas-15-like n=1 Tax=Tachypleus tridentatus TaxID=6853 RepID=UPI003FD31C2F
MKQMLWYTRLFPTLLVYFNNFNTNAYPLSNSCNESNTLSQPQKNTNGMLLDLELPHFVSNKTPISNVVLTSDTLLGPPIGPEDLAGIEHLTATDYAPPDGADPISRSGHFEGDIVEYLVVRNAIRDPQSKWPGGKIPYVISSEFSSRDRTVISAAFQEYEKKTCIRFVPRSNEQDYVQITGGSGCSSAVGRNGGPQVLTLGYGCVYVGVIVHELMHAVGFWHEQSRADRDEYVTILWNNIQAGMAYNFAKYTLQKIQHLGEPYDYASIMHYGEYAFSKSRNQPTIKPLRAGVTIGQRNGFSSTDIRKINKLYQCGVTGVTTTTKIFPTTVPPVVGCEDKHPSCEVWARQGECHRNPLWMLENCQKSCKQCKHTLCRDESTYCDFWKRNNQCQRNPSFMRQHCKKSCNICQGDPPIMCKDKELRCKIWADKGHCFRFVNFMKKECSKTCSFC